MVCGKGGLRARPGIKGELFAFIVRDISSEMRRGEVGESELNTQESLQGVP
jgi:hypothetical protein